MNCLPSPWLLLLLLLPPPTVARSDCFLLSNANPARARCSGVACVDENVVADWSYEVGPNAAAEEVGVEVPRLRPVDMRLLSVPIPNALSRESRLEDEAAAEEWGTNDDEAEAGVCVCAAEAGG